MPILTYDCANGTLGEHPTIPPLPDWLIGVTTDSALFASLHGKNVIQGILDPISHINGCVFEAKDYTNGHAGPSFVTDLDFLYTDWFYNYQSLYTWVAIQTLVDSFYGGPAGYRTAVSNTVFVNNSQPVISELVTDFYIETSAAPWEIEFATSSTAGIYLVFNQGGHAGTWLWDSQPDTYVTQLDVGIANLDFRFTYKSLKSGTNSLYTNGGALLYTWNNDGNVASPLAIPSVANIDPNTNSFLSMFTATQDAPAIIFAWQNAPSGVVPNAIGPSIGLQTKDSGWNPTVEYQRNAL